MLSEKDNFMVSYSTNAVFIHRRNPEDRDKITTITLNKHEAGALLESLKSNIESLMPSQ